MNIDNLDLLKDVRDVLSDIINDLRFIYTNDDVNAFQRSFLTSAMKNIIDANEGLISIIKDIENPKPDEFYAGYIGGDR
jgi:hypothetical protein